MITGGAVAVRMVARKVARMLLGTLKLAVAVTVSAMAIKWTQDKKYLLVDPSKSA